jgi:hypothetical protein
MTKLTDTQCVLLSTAAKRDRLSLYPLPEGLKPKGGLANAMLPLVKCCLVEERETTKADEIHRTDGDYRYGLFVTTAGLTAIGVECVGELRGEPTTTVSAPSVKQVTKIDTVLGLLRREDGATPDEMVTATSWLPHTTRAALTGLKKKGHVVDRGKRGNTTCYFIRAAA